MKLFEITNNWEHARAEMNIPKSAFKVDAHGFINVYWPSNKGREWGVNEFFRREHELVEDGHLNIKFGTVTQGDSEFGVFSSRELLDLTGMPSKVVGGTFTVRDCHVLESLRGAPKTVECNTRIINCPKLTSLKGLSGQIKNRNLILADLEIKNLDGLPVYFSGHLGVHGLKNIKSFIGIDKYFPHFVGTISWDFERIKKGGLGLLNIKGLKSISGYIKELPEPFQIINNHMKEKDIFACQTELIEAGYEKYAEL